ncbi:MAG: DUF4167 domain-containing protein [Xanthobacteraceae bacterium]|nr:DUF4167 domain-containing protein [Xanthobacteraceae bacterium]
MRNGQNKRMRGRNRNHKGHHGGGGGGGHHHNPLTRVYESNGPEVKIRGTAHHIAEKYLQLARDAQSAGDPVTAENHFQHAEHYFRLIAAAQEQFRQQNPYYQAPPAPGQSTSDEALDGEEDDGGPPAQGQPYQQGQPGQPQPNFGGQPNYGNQQPNFQPREQPQPYGGQQPNYQPRPQHQQSYSSNQPQQPQQPQYQPPQAEASDGERLPSFITGAQQPQAGGQGFTPNGHDANNGGNNPDGQRFPRHRRRRHRGGGPRPEMAGAAAQDFGGDGPEPGNS